MRKLILTITSACLLSTPVMAQMAAPTDAPPHQMMRHERGKMFDGMSVEGRKLIAVEMIDGREKMKANHEQRKAMREKIRVAMIADPYNANALRAVFDDERKMASDQQKMHHDHMVAMMSKLSAADRKIFAASLGRMEQHMGGKWKQGKGRYHDSKDMPPAPQN
jgi:Heavy-metal resistance